MRAFRVRLLAKFPDYDLVVRRCCYKCTPKDKAAVESGKEDCFEKNIDGWTFRYCNCGTPLCNGGGAAAKSNKNFFLGFLSAFLAAPAPESWQSP